MHPLHTLPSAHLLPRVPRCRFVSDFFPLLRGMYAHPPALSVKKCNILSMYSSDHSGSDSPDRPAPSSVAAKQKTSAAPTSAADARDLTPAEKLKRRMMLALAKTRLRDMQSTNVKAAAVAEEQRKTSAVREHMREVEVSHTSLHRLALTFRRRISAWSSGIIGAAGRAARHARLKIEGTGQRPTRARNTSIGGMMSIGVMMSSGVMMAALPGTQKEMAGGAMLSEWKSLLMPRLISKQRLLALEIGTGAPPSTQFYPFFCFISQVLFRRRSRSRSRERDRNADKEREREGWRGREREREGW